MDDELKAMSDVFGILEGLDEGARSRVLNWAFNKFDLSPAANNQPHLPAVITHENNDGDFKTFADLYNSAQPSNNGDKALLAGYWLQQCQGHTEFPSQLANKELQNLGHYLANITDAFTQLKSKKPALAIQVKKSGKSQQARKQYKLTQAGIDTVKSMISN